VLPLQRQNLYKGSSLSSGNMKAEQINGSWIINPDFGYFGWTSPVQKNRKGTTRITINKLVSTGLALKQGQRLCSYVAKDPSGRPIMVVYLDGMPRVVEVSA